MKNILVLVFSIFLISTNYANELDDIKNEIFAMAESFQGQIDEDGSKQASLESLVVRLLAVAPEKSFEDKALSALGVWNQVWGPYAFDDSNRLPPGIDVTKIYQFISDQGFYYNFGEYNFLGFNFKTYLRGKYEINSSRIDVEFTEQGLVREKDVNYATLGDLLNIDAVNSFSFPGFLPPAGVKGSLVEIYADEELRINYGVIGDDFSNKALFIMRRVR